MLKLRLLMCCQAVVLTELYVKLDMLTPSYSIPTCDLLPFLQQHRPMTPPWLTNEQKNCCCIYKLPRWQDYILLCLQDSQFEKISATMSC